MYENSRHHNNNYLDMLIRGGITRDVDTILLVPLPPYLQMTMVLNQALEDLNSVPPAPGECALQSPSRVTAYWRTQSLSMQTSP